MEIYKFVRRIFIYFIDFPTLKVALGMWSSVVACIGLSVLNMVKKKKNNKNNSPLSVNKCVRCVCVSCGYCCYCCC